MESGTIPNCDIIASSEESASTPAKNGRLNYASGSSWCAGTSDANPYLQIDLQTLHIICAVSTQGNSQADQWVKNYTLQFSIDGTTWTDYKEGGQVKFLRGNADRKSEVKHVVYRVLTRYLRFLPWTHQGGVCMRIEVFGLKNKPTCEMEAIGLASGGTIPDSSFSASSHFNHGYIPSNGRLNGTSRGWAPKTNFDSSDYLQIDLPYEYVICAVATQGANGINKWTTTYKIRLSMDGTTMVTYKENNVDKVFPGNSNQNGIVKNSLQEVVVAKYILFQPITYCRWKVLRVEVYGVPLTKVPSQPPTSFKLTTSSSTSIIASWQLPPVPSRHGRTITGFKLFYKKKGFGGSETNLTVNSGLMLNRSVTGLDKFTEYEFQVLAYTSDGDGPMSPVEVKRTKEDAPSGPPSQFTVFVNSSTSITVSWQLPPEGLRHGIIIGYKMFYKKKGSGFATILTLDNGNTSTTVTKLDKYTEYEFKVLAFTSAGDGPNSSSVLRTTMEDAPGAPTSLSSVDVPPSKSHGPRITLTWSEPAEPNGVIRSYTLFYSHKGGAPREIHGIDKHAVSHTVNVFGGVTYQFKVRAVTLKPGTYETTNVTTKTYAPEVPVPNNKSDVEVSETAADILLWPVEQINGPISAYQVVILKVVNGVEELPENYESQLKAASDAKNDDVNFYIAAEIENVPVLNEPWKFTVGDGGKTGNYVNKELEKGQNYIVFERALTKTNKEVLKGEAASVAKISITSRLLLLRTLDPLSPDLPLEEAGTEGKHSDLLVASLATELVVVIIAAVMVAVFFYRRRGLYISASGCETCFQGENLQNYFGNPTASTSTRRSIEDNHSRVVSEEIEVDKNTSYINASYIPTNDEVTITEEKEATYSEADDDELSRVVLEEIEGDKNSGYISTSNISEVLKREVRSVAKISIIPAITGIELQPDSEEEEVTFSGADDGKPKPNRVAKFAKYLKKNSENGATALREECGNLPDGMQFRYGYIDSCGIFLMDIWRLIWRENCSIIVMLTVGKGKCDHYWPDDTSKYGNITVTLQKTEPLNTKADYVIRSFILKEDSEKRKFRQFHYLRWPDKGVPQHTEGLLEFRKKVHARHKASGGPLLIHCSDNVGLSGTGIDIAIRAMFGGAENMEFELLWLPGSIIWFRKIGHPD